MEKLTDETYKKYTLALLIGAAAALVVCAAAFSLKRNITAVQTSAEQNLTGYYSPNTNASQENESRQTAGISSEFDKSRAQQNVDKTESTDGNYLVTVYNGKIGVFEGGAPKPFVTADVDVYLLPQEDISILRKGIKAESFAEVKRILEDYR